MRLKKSKCVFLASDDEKIIIICLIGEPENEAAAECSDGPMV